eukprot:350708-Chlamydomonas_euryale.AAC.4
MHAHRKSRSGTWAPPRGERPACLQASWLASADRDSPPTTVNVTAALAYLTQEHPHLLPPHHNVCKEHHKWGLDLDRLPRLPGLTLERVA